MDYIIATRENPEKEHIFYLASISFCVTISINTRKEEKKSGDADEQEGTALPRRGFGGKTSKYEPYQGQGYEHRAHPA